MSDTPWTEEEDEEEEDEEEEEEEERGGDKQEEEEEEKEEDEEKCIVCLHTRINMMSLRKTVRKMIPCGHFDICKPCFHRCDKCPLCRKPYRNNEHVMTMVEETRLIYKLQRVIDRRDALNEKISELQIKRSRIEDEYAELTAIRARQRLLLRRRANHLDASNFVNV